MNQRYQPVFVSFVLAHFPHPFSSLSRLRYPSLPCRMPAPLTLTDGHQLFRERFATPSDLSVFVFRPAHCSSFTLSSFVYIFTRFLTTFNCSPFARLLSHPIADSPGSRSFPPVRSRLAQPRAPLRINLAPFDTDSCRRLATYLLLTFPFLLSQLVSHFLAPRTLYSLAPRLV
jgi:hypothetical protein